MRFDIHILGAGVAGFNLAKRLKENGFSGEIYLIDKRRYYFERKSTFSLLVKDKIEVVDLKKISSKLGINFIPKKVERINFSKRRLFFKDGGFSDFKNLVIATGVISKDLSFLKGKNYEGVFFLSEIDPFFVRDYLRISEEITIFSFTFLGIKLAFFLSSLEKEIRLFLSPSFTVKKKLLESLISRGIDIHFEKIEEIIGEKEVKAVKTEKGKFYSSQCVFVDSGFKPNTKLFDCSLDFSYVYLLGDVKNKEIENRYYFFKNNYFCQKEANSLALSFIEKQRVKEIIC